MIENSIAQVEDLVADGILNGGQGNSLISKLENALKKIEQEKVTPAVNMLEAFKNQVNAFIAAGILMPEEGQSLIAAVDLIIANLTG